MRDLIPRAERAGRLLKSRGETIAVAESSTGGLISAAVLLLLSYFFSFLTYHSKDWENFIQGSPTLLIHHGRLIHSNLRQELMSIRELRVLLRKQGIHDLAEIEEAVLESDGFISITRKTDPEHDEPAGQKEE